MLHRMNVRMVDAAVETLREVDVVALIFDASTRPGHGDEFVTALLEKVRNPVVLVLNKIDLVKKAQLLPLMERVQKWREFAAIVPVSAQTGDGIDRLERVLLEPLPEGESPTPENRQDAVRVGRDRRGLPARNRQPLAALSATTAQDLAAVLRLHAVHEAMSAQPPALLRLIGSLGHFGAPPFSDVDIVCPA